MQRRSKIDGGITLLTVKDVAALDHCSEKTVRRAIEAGLLEAIRIGPSGRLLRDPTPQRTRLIAGDKCIDHF